MFANDAETASWAHQKKWRGCAETCAFVPCNEIEVRKEDVGLIEDVIPDVIKEYIALLKENVKSLEGRDIKAKVKISTKRHLPPRAPKGATGPSWYELFNCLAVEA